MTPSLSVPLSMPQPSFPTRSQQGHALCLRVPGAQTEAVQCGAWEALRCHQAIPTPGRWRDPPAPWRQGQRSVSTLLPGRGHRGALASADPQGIASTGPPVETQSPERAERGFEWASATLMSIGRVGSCLSGMGVHCRDGRGGPGEASTGPQGWVVRGLGRAQDGFRHVLGLWEGHQETGSAWGPAAFQGEM